MELYAIRYGGSNRADIYIPRRERATDKLLVDDEPNRNDNNAI